jgi:subtilisin family serine protease
MTRKQLLFTLLIFLPLLSFSQNRYWVFFSNKQGSVLDTDAFHPMALERRIKMGLNGFDSTDFPVSSSYVQQVSKRVKSVGKPSRWLNAIVIEASSSQLTKISRLPFVKSVEPVMGHFYVAKHREEPFDNSSLNDLRERQLARFNGDLFRSQGVDGKGVRIAVFDAGFPGADTHPAFEHLRKSNRIVATYDFTQNNPNVYRANSHGTSVLSCIAGINNGEPMGLATGAEFLLAITEVGREPFSEEENWLAALEWADRNGAQIINSSLGYTYHRYFPEQMDGKTSFVSRAATMAARKGILVVNAAGNEGNDKWSVIGAPADADSILTVGGVSPYTHLHINFASFGPTADGRLKPNVSAFGEAQVANKKGGFSSASGTSFASPLTAGFAACALQLNPKATAMELLTLIEQSADLYPYYDYAHGYGVPQANLLFNAGKVQPNGSKVKFQKKDEGVWVVISDFNPQQQAGYNTTHLFWHIRKPNGMLAEYGVIRVFQSKAFFVPTNSAQVYGNSLWINYLGETYNCSL